MSFGKVSLVVRLLLLLVGIVTVLLPLTALADGSGSIEPPIQQPDPDPVPPEGGLTDIGVVIVEASLLLT